MIRALLKFKIRAKKAVLDPVHSQKVDLRREEMFRCLSSLIDDNRSTGNLSVFQEFSRALEAIFIIPGVFFRNSRSSERHVIN